MSLPRISAIPFVILFIVLVLFSGQSMAETGQKAIQEIKKGTVTGRIMVKDRESTALSWGHVMFYNVLTGPAPMPHKYERTPDISRTMDADGKFSVEIPEGIYYIGAIKRLSGDKLGPPQAGDYVFRLLNEKKNPKAFFVRSGEVIDIGTVSEAFQVTEEDLADRRVTTALEGTVFSTDWTPVAGAVVIAFRDATIGRKPLFVSTKSDKDGKYVLPLTEGTYYLRVRNSFAAGPPEPGQIIGYYGEGTPKPVSVKDCEIIKGIDFQVVVFRGRGPSPQRVPKSQL